MTTTGQRITEYETPWPFPGLPSPGDTIRAGSMEDVKVLRVTATRIELENGRAFNRA